VLPFENRTADETRAYFAGSLHDELLTQLMKVAALKVISRTSVLGYAQTTKPLDTIAAELRVGTIVEGSVQVEGERLLVNVRLFDVETGEPLWAERYERTLDDAFAIQSTVAQQIVRAVGAALTEDEASAIAAAPTDNEEAYRLYLQGEEYRRRPGYLPQNLEIAQQQYERALALDPEFALAHAALSDIHGVMVWFGYDTSPERLDRQREEAEIALRLAPELPQAHIAMGRLHYFVRGDWQAALDEYGIALQGLPDDARLWTFIGQAHRRLGSWDQVDVAFEMATRLDPRNANLYNDLGGNTLRSRRRYPDAIAAYDRALTLAPDLHDAAISKGHSYLAWKGELDTLRAVLERVPPTRSTLPRLEMLLWERNPDSLLAVLRNARDAELGGEFSARLRPLWAAWAHTLRGDTGAARAAFDSTIVTLDSVLAVSPDLWTARSARGWALAGAGRWQEALSEARWLRESPEYGRDAYAPVLKRDVARILAQAGEPDAALDEIEQLLGRAGRLNVNVLRLDPRWDPIRDHPRFQELLEEYAEPKPVR
jgi:serine/threonine-protein kinase